MSKRLVRPAIGGVPILLDFSRCARWYIPIASFYRVKALIVCAVTTQHAVNGEASLSLHDEKHWWDICQCGYFGIERKNSWATN